MKAKQKNAINEGQFIKHDDKVMYCDKWHEQHRAVIESE